MIWRKGGTHTPGIKKGLFPFFRGSFPGILTSSAVPGLSKKARGPRVSSYIIHLQGCGMGLALLPATPAPCSHPAATVKPKKNHVPPRLKTPQQSPPHPEKRCEHSTLLITAETWGQPSVHRQEGGQTNRDPP